MTRYAPDDPPLFDDNLEPIAHARKTDPETSHAAANSVREITRRQKAVLEVLAIQGALPDPDIAEHYERFRSMWPDNYPRQTESGLRTRRHELVNRFLVEDSGSRHITHTGRQCIVWRLTPAGRAAVLDWR